MSVSAFGDLPPMTEGIVPVSLDERRGRVEKARALMAENRIDAVFVEPGSSLFYFLGVRWSRSERVTAAVIPARGEVAYVSPAFEEARLREGLLIGDDVRVWEEDENPFALVARILRDRGVRRLGLEGSVRFFLLDGIRREAPHVECVGADPVTVPCRAVKSSAEIALMQRAMDITVAAYKACLPLLEEGMTRKAFQAASAQAHAALGVSGGISCQIGETTAYPHGGGKSGPLRPGDVVLMDGGCTVEGYHSDISRTVVFGVPTRRQRDIWDLEKEAQAAAFNAAGVGVPCEEVDAAAREVITAAGFGPDYEVPGLPHRTGHGIGLDVHEPQHIVRGNRAPLEPGMCFTDEPMIAIYGEFGVRLEDCVYITEDGPRFFTQPSPSIARPFA